MESRTLRFVGECATDCAIQAQLSLTKEIHINFYTCDLAVGICHACDNFTPKKPVIENQACNNCTPKLNMTCVGACACDHTPFLVRPEVSSYLFICLFMYLFYFIYSLFKVDRKHTIKYLFTIK